MEDYIVRGIAAEGEVRAFAIHSNSMVEEARRRHDTSPVMTAALGRLLSAASMMGAMLKEEKALITLQIQCDGPAEGLIATADSQGNVKGFATSPKVEGTLKAPGKLDVGAAIGKGSLRVTKDIGLKDPYVGQCDLVTGEIGDDLAYYFTMSEQTPSAVGLGVLVDTDWTVKQAGGFILQLMPGATEEVISALENNLGKIKSVTALMEEGLTPEEILEKLLGNLDLEILDRIPVEFKCDCSKERVSRALAAISHEDLEEMIESGETIKVKCDFCNTDYEFTTGELSEIRDSRQSDGR